MTSACTNPDDQDDTGSMPVAMLLTVVLLSMSLVLLNTVVREVGSSRTDVGRTQALNAATTGLEMAIGAVRASVDSHGNGVLAKLPCTTLTGTVTGAQSGSYRVTIQYFLQDPRGHDDDWRAANGKACATTLSTAANFATVHSDGTDPISGRTRTLEAVYTFKVATNVNVPGDAVHVYLTSLCLDAGAATAGVPVRTQPCVTPVPDRQKFGYAKNLTFVLTSSVSSAYPNGLCLDAGTPGTLGATLSLQPCGPSTQVRQQWSYAPNGLIFGTSDGHVTNGYCFAVKFPNSSNSTIVMSNNSQTGPDGNGACDATHLSDSRSFSPSSAVGAGGAGPDTGQIVNYLRFSRCLDVRSYNVNNDLQIYPCKQSPDPSNLEWNEVWTLPSTGLGVIATNSPQGNYCMVAPLSGAVDRAATLDPCPAAGAPVPDRMIWWVRGSTADTYAEKYRIETTGTLAGSCLAADLATDPANMEIPVLVSDCSDDDSQKWNAQSDLRTPRLSDFEER